MAGNFNQSMNQSVKDFQMTILPILKGLWRNCDYIHLEIQDNELAQSLDENAGFDLLRINHNTKSSCGIASRIQRDERNWETFTVRCERDNGTPTEYFKRVLAIKTGELFPKLTYQAYLSLTGTFFSMGLAMTKDLINFIIKRQPPVKHTKSYQSGQASFFVIDWNIFAADYELIRITPTADGYKAKWSKGEKLIKGIENEKAHALQRNIHKDNESVNICTKPASHRRGGKGI